MDSDIKRAKRPAESSKKDTPAETEIFRTPEQVAADQMPDDTLGADMASKKDDSSSKKPQKKPGWLHRLKFTWPPNKREKEWAAVITVVLIVAMTGVFLLISQRGPKPVATAEPKITKKAAPKPTTLPSTLTGLPVDPSVNNRPVTGVMIENSIYARPQSGLGQAGVVFEAIAEGGITRFVALYQDTAPDNVGPIRSARPYYAQWVLGFDAGYAHVGGSPEALADIKAWSVRDLDQFYNSGSYHRISSRAAPHNVYTSIAALNQLEASKGYTTSKYTGFARKTKETPSKQPNAKTIDIRISGPTYGVHYDYAPATNSYNRSVGGAPHIDANTNTQISPKVVIAMVMPYRLEPDGYHSDYTTIGSGPVYIFQDGWVGIGQWTKSAPTSQFTFTDAAGKPIKLNPGTTWLTAISSTGNITYAP